MENRINVESRDIGTIQCDVNKIEGNGYNIYPHLIIPLQINFNNPEVVKKDEKKFDQYYKIISLSAGLYFKKDTNILISQSGYVSLLYSSQQVDRSKHIILPLDFNIIEFIETNRTNNACFEMIINLQIAKNNLIEHDNCSKDLIILDLIPCSSPISIDLEILKSKWIEEILPKIGYGKYSLIKIPIPEAIESDKMKKVICELDNANNYFVKGDYNKVVEHCRKAIELIIKLKKITKKWENNPKFNEKIEEFIEEHIRNKLGKEKSELIINTIKSLWKICSKSHHAGKLFFNREDAIFVFANTSYIVKYIANILEEN
jgi:hypothetical protein